MSENKEYQIKCLKVGLDKLTLTVTPHDMTPYADFAKQLKSVAKYDDDITFASPGAQAGYRFAGRLKISSASSTAWPLLQVAPYGKGPFFRLECNPKPRSRPDAYSSTTSSWHIDAVAGAVHPITVFPVS
jgi:hypothetical protein